MNQPSRLPLVLDIADVTGQLGSNFERVYTLASEGGIRLEQVQYAARHADPRTTQRYRKRKVNLDDNAVDYLKL